ncbi:TBP-associated factor II 15 [Prunus dulcis]|uniref:TBP-associated factor II 15 n=4 Tax=Prunus TaxID=3754 RepID=A0A4Y1QT38_PRUDU|nr:TBP-associated factor II 15 [Prunus dulcis]
MRTYNGCTQEREVDEPFKVGEAETVNIPPPPTEKLLVLGGNGFVGSHVCREALDRGLSVASLSRSGRSSLHDPWASNVTWHKGNLLSPESLKDALDGVTSVISCVGGFGSNSYMYKINGTANINAIRAASEQGVKRFVYVSAADFGVRAAETELLTKFPYGGVILRPGFIYGTRSVGSVKLPLGVIGSPLEMLFQHTRPLNQLPLVGPLFTPPVNVTAVANVAVRAATDPVFPPGIVDVYGIQRYNQKSNTARVSNQYRISEREKMNHNQNQNQNQQSSEGSRHDDDAALTEFLASLMDYTPTIPDELVEHYLAKSGFQCPDVRLIRLVAVATQKFVSEVATDALQQCKARQASVVKDKRDKQQKDKRLILTMEDLSRALREYGVNVKHQEYFADSPSTGLDPASREE